MKPVNNLAFKKKFLAFMDGIKIPELNFTFTALPAFMKNETFEKLQTTLLQQNLQWGAKKILYFFCFSHFSYHHWKWSRSEMSWAVILQAKNTIHNDLLEGTREETLKLT